MTLLDLRGRDVTALEDTYLGRYRLMLNNNDHDPTIGDNIFWENWEPFWDLREELEEKMGVP